jgi:hypothetical protein
MKALDNNWDQIIDFWFYKVKEGYIIEFSIECSDSFIEVERNFVECPRNRLLEEVLMWIKMLFIEKGLMCMDPNKMVD